MIPTCFSCVALGVGEWVERFYSMLGYMPWWKFDSNHPEGRQTGRSTHGMLEALALAHDQRIPRLACRSPYGQFAEQLMRQKLDDYAKMLGVSVEVTPYNRGELICVVYKDHEKPFIMGHLRG